MIVEQTSARSTGRGRARDPSTDARALDAAARHLAVLGYEAMSVSAVAEEAGTTRQALYSRWACKADLKRGCYGPAGSPWWARCCKTPSRPTFALATRPTSSPRRRRLGHILERAQRLDVIDRDADLEVAGHGGDRCWYARALAGSSPLRSWPQRTATLLLAGRGRPADGSRTGAGRPGRAWRA